jgi:multidrug efflux pump
LKLSEVSIRRPVLAMIMTLVLFGVLSATRLSVRQYPDISAPFVSIQTVYPGASARLVETDVTTVLEEALSGIESVKTFTSASREEISLITLEFERSRDLDDAANDVRDRVFGSRRWLPPGIDEPMVSKASADAQAIVWLSLYSDRATELELTDYAERHIKDRLAAAPGVAAVWVWGARHYAMRVWFDGSPDVPRTDSARCRDGTAQSKRRDPVRPYRKRSNLMYAFAENYGRPISSIRSSLRPGTAIRSDWRTLAMQK